MRDSQDLSKRRKSASSDDLQFYKARIYKNVAVGDDRLQVRPIPQLADITEVECLPVFPPLQKGKIIRGKTEVEEGPISADLVLIVSTPDFHFGYVIDVLNKFESNDLETKMSDSYDYDSLKTYLNDKQILPSSFSWEDLRFQHWSEEFDDNGETVGGICEFYNFRTGDKFILSTTGYIFALTGDKVLLRVGAGDSDPLGGKKCSFLQMTPEKILFSGPCFQLDCELVRLSNGALKVLGTNAGLIPTAVDGQPIIASKGVFF
jgi:hypothetical protein